MKPIEKKTEENNDEASDEHTKQLYIFFDFECRQEDIVQCEQGYERGDNGKCVNCAKASCGSREHMPNVCVAQRVCSECIHDDITPESVCEQCGKNEHVFSGPTTTDEFCKWLFSEENEGATVLCHNFQGYDSYPILKYLYTNGVKPNVIPNGAKNMSIEVPECNIRMIDSLNFIPTALANLPDMFGFTELSKGFFPHFYNKTENQNAVLDQLPDVCYYNTDAMKSKDRKSFLAWYEANKNSKFDFQYELLKYCRSDVDILRRCCLKFRSMFMDVSSTDVDDGIDPFEHCITIASACQRVFRTKFLKQDSIGIIPPLGYKPEEKQSVKALQWMKYVAFSNNVRVQHARNGGEVHVGNYKADGYYEKDGQKLILEFQGCFWHGCPRCFARDTINPINRTTMADLFQNTLDRKAYLQQQGYTVIEKWECDFDRELVEDHALRAYVSGLDIVTPIDPRDAFHGGRTEAFTLYKERSGTESIHYYDVTSLYPFINKTGKVVVGHPKIITENFGDVNNYEGLIKCRIIPPRGLYVPVLPSKINGKLLFALCRTCGESQQQCPCSHSDMERAMTDTWITDEVKKAIDKGYRIETIYEVWHFDRVEQYDTETKTGGIFTGYINTFLKLKQEPADGLNGV